MAKVCDHPACYNEASGKLMLKSTDSLFGKTRVTMYLCPRHYNDMLEFFSGYLGIPKEA